MAEIRLKENESLESALRRFKPRGRKLNAAAELRRGYVSESLFIRFQNNPNTKHLRRSKQ